MTADQGVEAARVKLELLGLVADLLRAEAMTPSTWALAQAGFDLVDGRESAGTR